MIKELKLLNKTNIISNKKLIGLGKNSQNDKGLVCNCKGGPGNHCDCFDK